jgi:endonuclease/exonuclease/phosphatase (EEP) superfamily protein YafD
MIEASRPVADASTWQCVACGTHNRARPRRTPCTGCGAPPPAAEASGSVRVVRPRPRARGIAWLSWLLAIVVLAILVTIRWVGQRWWGTTLLLFFPRWLLLVPVALLGIASAVARRPSQWVLQGAIALVIAGPLMGLSLPLWRVGQGRPQGKAFRVLTYNVSSNPIDTPRLIEFIETEGIDLICLQENGRLSPALDAYFRKGWYRDSRKFVASRYPIAQEYDPFWEVATIDDRSSARLACVRIRPPGSEEFVLASLHMPTLRPGLNRFLAGDRAGLALHTQWWTSELERVVESLAKTGGEPMIVAGDFNMPSDDSAMAALRACFRFAFEEAGWGYGYTRPSTTPWFRIDHIVASREWAFTRCWVGPDFGSDHLPLVAEAILPAPPAKSTRP